MGIYYIATSWRNNSDTLRIQVCGEVGVGSWDDIPNKSPHTFASVYIVYALQGQNLLEYTRVTLRSAFVEYRCYSNVIFCSKVDSQKDRGLMYTDVIRLRY